MHSSAKQQFEITVVDDNLNRQFFHHSGKKKEEICRNHLRTPFTSVDKSTDNPGTQLVGVESVQGAEFCVPSTSGDITGNVDVLL